MAINVGLLQTRSIYLGGIHEKFCLCNVTERLIWIFLVCSRKRIIGRFDHLYYGSPTLLAEISYTCKITYTKNNFRMFGNNSSFLIIRMYRSPQSHVKDIGRLLLTEEGPHLCTLSSKTWLNSEREKKELAENKLCSKDCSSLNTNLFVNYLTQIL
jgi:hypothetical protein